MRLGVPVEPESENRVAIVPNSVKKLVKSGFEVVIEAGAGANARHADSEYEAAGASIGTNEDVMGSDIIIAIRMPDISKMKEGKMLATLVGREKDTKAMMTTVLPRKSTGEWASRD